MMPERLFKPVYRCLLLLVGVLVILVVGITSNLEFFQRMNSLVEVGEEPYIDGITLWEDQFTLMRDLLPDSGVIGYLADWDFPGQEESTDLETEFRLTQYALAPVVVARGSDYAVVIGNITVENFDGELEDHYRLLLQHDYGNGILLLRDF
jgi:hypothetical protein